MKGIGYWWPAASNTSGYSLLLSLPSLENKNLRKISLRFSFSSSCLTTWLQQGELLQDFNFWKSTFICFSHHLQIPMKIWKQDLLICTSVGIFVPLVMKENPRKEKTDIYWYIHKIWDHKSLCLPRRTLPHFCLSSSCFCLNPFAWIKLFCHLFLEMLKFRWL